MPLKRWFAGLTASAAVFAAAPALAADAGLLIVGSTPLDTPNGSVVLVDLGSARRTGDEVKAQIVMVLTNNQTPESRGISHMVGEETLNCRTRMAVTTKIAAYAEDGPKVGEFDTGDEPKPAQDGTPYGRMLDRVCSGQGQDGEAEPFADVASAVSFVRGVVSAVTSRTSPMQPHRFVFVGQTTNSTGSRTAAFVDMANLEHDGDALVRWVVLINTPAVTRSGREVLYDLTQVAFDCTGGRARIRYAEALAPDGTSIFGGIQVSPWMRAENPGTLADLQLKAGCAAAPADGGLETLEAAADYARRAASATPATAPGQRGI